MPTTWWHPPDRYVAPWDAPRVVGARLHALRLEAEMTVHELGWAASVHPVQIRYYERGGPISLHVLARLARALDLEVIDLLWDLRHPPPRPRWRPRTTVEQARQTPGARARARINTRSR